MNWPEKWGFSGDLRDCIGRTIEAVELVEMEHASLPRQGWLIRFTDFSRAFLVDGTTTRIMVGPSKKALESSSIVQPSEIAELAAHEHRVRQQRTQESRRQEEQQLAALATKLGKKVV